MTAWLIGWAVVGFGVWGAFWAWDVLWRWGLRLRMREARATLARREALLGDLSAGRTPVETLVEVTARLHRFADNLPPERAQECDDLLWVCERAKRAFNEAERVQQVEASRKAALARLRATSPGL